METYAIIGLIVLIALAFSILMVIVVGFIHYKGKKPKVNKRHTMPQTEHKKRQQTDKDIKHLLSTGVLQEKDRKYQKLRQTLLTYVDTELEAYNLKKRGDENEKQMDKGGKNPPKKDSGNRQKGKADKPEDSANNPKRRTSTRSHRKGGRGKDEQPVSEVQAQKKKDHTIRRAGQQIQQIIKTHGTKGGNHQRSR